MRGEPSERRNKGSARSDPDRRPTKSEMRIGGIVATVVLIFLALFTFGFIWMA